MLKQQIRTKTHLLFFRADNCRSHKRSIASSFTRRQLLTSTATVAMVLKQSERDRVQSIASQQKEVREFEKGESLKQLTRLKVGDVIANGAFEVTATETVDDYQIHAVSLRHLRTGAKWLHVGADDSNNAFNVGFKTVPMDDTGVAHILEHTTLCGSKKYPIRDPFFNMLRRSLSTFMNAMTSADFTCYPFAMKNKVFLKFI